METYKYHRFFIAFIAVITLVIGIFLGNFLAGNLGTVDLGVVIIGLVFTSIVVLLVISSLLLEITKILQSKKKGKKQ